MHRAAVVVADHGKIKEIEVSRETACEGCSQNKNGTCHACIMLGDGNRSMRTRALDELGAKVGDRVEVETDSKTVIKYAAEVFLLPIILGAAGYLIGENFAWKLAPLVCSLIGFAMAFVYVKLVPAKRAENHCDVKIVKILGER